MKEMISIALPKGRLGDRVYRMFAKAGYPNDEIEQDGRKLVFESPASGVRYFLVKPADVHVYVERGAADIGVCGKDILLEYAPDVYELLDLACRLSRLCSKISYLLGYYRKAPSGFSCSGRFNRSVK